MVETVVLHNIICKYYTWAYCLPICVLMATSHLPVIFFITQGRVRNSSITWICSGFSRAKKLLSYTMDMITKMTREKIETKYWLVRRDIISQSFIRFWIHGKSSSINQYNLLKFPPLHVLEILFQTMWSFNFFTCIIATSMQSIPLCTYRKMALMKYFSNNEILWITFFQEEINNFTQLIKSK